MAAYPGYSDPNTVLKPSVPYIGPLPALQDGFMVHINGKARPRAGRFHINLSAGGALSGCDIPIHINPRFEPTNQIVRNSFLGNCWGGEDRSGGFPLKKHQDFEMIVLVTNACYKIAINGTHFCDYPHRTPKERVTHLVIEGDVVIHQIRHQHPFQAGTMVSATPGYVPPPNSSAPAFTPPHVGYPAAGYPAAPPQGYPVGYQPPPPAGGYFPPPSSVPAGQAVGHYPGQQPPQPLTPMKMPHKQQLKGGLSAGRVIKIHGMPKQKPNQFAINLRCRNDSNIAFHFNPRFGEKVVVRNTHMAGKWGTEERQEPKFPFKPGQQFNVMIFVESEWFRVTVNNEDFITYNHRKRQLDHIVSLEVTGDMDLYSIQF